jgi:hypothetical protein
MAKDDKPSAHVKSEDDPRAAALRANLAKRKGQGGARRSGKAVGKTEPSAFDRVRDKQQPGDG